MEQQTSKLRDETNENMQSLLHIEEEAQQGCSRDWLEQGNKKVVLVKRIKKYSKNNSSKNSWNIVLGGRIKRRPRAPHNTTQYIRRNKKYEKIMLQYGHITFNSMIGISDLNN